MGEEIRKSSFTDEDFERFEEKLRAETSLLEQWFQAGKFSKRDRVAGLEVEAWLVDKNGTPQPRNAEYLAALNDPLVVHEVSAFNVEMNCPPEKLEGRALSKMQDSLTAIWNRAQAAANAMGLDLVMIGTLPTLKDNMLTLANMSQLERYKALNEQVLHMRGGRPIELDIKGKQHLKSTHNDVMLEAAATAFQMHLQVPQDKAARFYNASKILSAPLAAIGANSPFLFGKDVWAETRVPLFEQAVSVGKWDYAERVTFGVRYLEKSLMGAFKANVQRYPVIIPATFDEGPEKMHHLKLHNGTIWRWNRPLIGTDDDGTPHLRIEQRVLSSGPTIVDMVANMAFYYGLVYWMVEDEPEIEHDIPFYRARDNFYEAAQNGLDAKITWKKQRDVAVRDLILTDLLPKAREGLEFLGLDAADIDKYLGIIEGRARTGQNGAAWQRAFVAKHGRNMNKLCKAYLRHQESGAPVHGWKFC